VSETTCTPLSVRRTCQGRDSTASAATCDFVESVHTAGHAAGAGRRESASSWDTCSRLFTDIGYAYKRRVAGDVPGSVSLAGRRMELLKIYIRIVPHALPTKERRLYILLCCISNTFLQHLSSHSLSSSRTFHFNRNHWDNRPPPSGRTIDHPHRGWHKG
jgi:hypothetical protein